MLTIWILPLAATILALVVYTVRAVRNDGYGDRTPPASHHSSWCVGTPDCGCR